MWRLPAVLRLPLRAADGLTSIEYTEKGTPRSSAIIMTEAWAAMPPPEGYNPMPPHRDSRPASSKAGRFDVSKGRAKQTVPHSKTHGPAIEWRQWNITVNCRRTGADIDACPASN